MDFSGDVGFSPGCCHPSCLGTVSLLPCQWGHSFCLPYYHIIYHYQFQLPPSLVLVTILFLLLPDKMYTEHVNYTGIFRGHRQGTYISSWVPRMFGKKTKKQKHFLELPRSRASERWEEKNRIESGLPSDSVSILIFKPTILAICIVGDYKQL